MSYYKYLKYKNKYLSLKGGAAAGITWECPSCTFQNNKFLENCKKCGTKKPWRCSNCPLLNKDYLEECEACGVKKPWQCSNCPLLNEDYLKECEACGEKKPWKCLNCPLLNKDYLEECEVCGVKKPAVKPPVIKPPPVKQPEIKPPPVKQPPVKQPWECSMCSFLNETHLTECDVCGGKKPEIKPPAVKQPVVKPSEAVSGLAQKIFYLYTTGIGDWGGFTIIEQWAKVRTMVLKNIHNSFTHIEIKHYDPFEGVVVDKRIIDAIKQKLNEDNLIKNVSSEFKQEYIDFKSLKKPHLIIDFAHIVKSTDISDHSLNSLYFGYLGGSIAQALLTQKLFTMDSNGNSETITNKTMAYNKDFNDPSQIIRPILEDIKKEIVILLKQKGKPLKLIDDLDIDNKPGYYVYAVDKIMEGIPPIELKGVEIIKEFKNISRKKLQELEQLKEWILNDVKKKLIN